MVVGGTSIIRRRERAMIVSNARVATRQEFVRSEADSGDRKFRVSPRASTDGQFDRITFLAASHGRGPHGAGG
jgi:hypothetical protein